MGLRGRKMLRDKEAKKEEEEELKPIEINAGMQGSLRFSDPVQLEINGTFSGSLDMKGSLTIGSVSVVDANITGDRIIIAGKVNGNVTANHMLVLMPSAVIKGNITTPKLNIVEGAIFQGKCQMLSITPEDEGPQNTPEKFFNNNEKEKDEESLDLDQVSKYLEIDMKEIEQLANAGKIPGTKNGDVWKFNRMLIDSWASSGKVK